MQSKVSFVAFFMIWAKVQGWKVPALHVRICEWLQDCADLVRVLMVFRGAAKSTIFGVYKAWLLYRDPTRRNLIWGEDTRLAKKLTRDTLTVLRRHPLCRTMLPSMVGVEEFWVRGSTDARNASMAAYGVMSNATGSRADAVDFDDIEVPKNIKTAEAREKLRERISESTHILVPGGQKTYIGTPHTHDSIYEEQIEGGAAVLKIPLFEHHKRYEGEATQSDKRYGFHFPIYADGLYVFVGIGKYARLLVEGVDYHATKREVVLLKPPGDTLDIYSGCAWPERFTRKDIERRRKDTRTLNAWDSQYGLEAKPLHAVRLDPDRLRPYEVEPVIEMANGEVRMMLGKTRIVSATSRWDCALGRLTGDASAFGVMLQNAEGTYFWHRSVALTGDVFAQCKQIRDIVQALQLPRVVVETNGLGSMAVQVLRKELRALGVGVEELHETADKNKRIIDAFEAPLSARMIWAHVSTYDTVYDEMKDWRPDVKEQPDNHLDAGAGALKDQPVRIGRAVSVPVPSEPAGAWRPNSGDIEVELDFS